jgi:hypothetical protein
VKNEADAVIESDPYDPLGSDGEKEIRKRLANSVGKSFMPLPSRKNSGEQEIKELPPHCAVHRPDCTRSKGAAIA